MCSRRKLQEVKYDFLKNTNKLPLFYRKTSCFWRHSGWFLPPRIRIHMYFHCSFVSNSKSKMLFLNKTDAFKLQQLSTFCLDIVPPVQEGQGLHHQAMLSNDQNVLFYLSPHSCPVILARRCLKLCILLSGLSGLIHTSICSRIPIKERG